MQARDTTRSTSTRPLLSLLVAVRCNALQCVAVHCCALHNTVQHTVRHCWNVYVAMCSNEHFHTLHYSDSSEYCDTTLTLSVVYSVFWCMEHVTNSKQVILPELHEVRGRAGAVFCLLQCIAVCLTALRCVAVRCSALLCVAVRCKAFNLFGALQCVDVR